MFTLAVGTISGRIIDIASQNGHAEKADSFVTMGYTVRFLLFELQWFYSQSRIGENWASNEEI